ncbi:ribonuclease P protein component [Rothia sp. AR01]|uniref:Ribonuclease P protein component n=1 Tax=Rothia santali TaxID=2949643 RepID=A0A9X2HD52_9MICC|nr:ribonuclease P protein component [Rothia santali]MCP3425517.1 ribonuclease P protein component [Rothia santali]
MLAQQHRMRTSVQFSETTRSGARSGRRNLVLYAHLTDESSPSLGGFIVSKAVGNAVVRNRVKRRLRELAAVTLAESPTGLDLVVRALPPASDAGWQDLREEYRGALRTALRKARARAEGR